MIDELEDIQQEPSVEVEEPVVEQEPVSAEPALPEEMTPAAIVETNETKIISDMIKAESQDEFDSLLSLFNLTQSKKKIVRVSQYNELLDAVTDEALRRYKRNPNEITNKELLDCISVVATQLEKSEQSLKPAITSPTIQVNQSKNQINVVFPQYTQDEKANVIDAVNKILAAARQEPIPDENQQPIIIETDLTAETEPIESTEQGENEDGTNNE